MKKLSYMLAIVMAGSLGLSPVTQARGYQDAGGYERGAGPHRFEKQVDRRQARQYGRISDGLNSGDLSRREAKRLVKDQRKIARMERRFERDGYYSPRERRIMDRALDRASHRIHRAKNNDPGWSRGGHHRGGHHGHHGYRADPYAYETYEDSYVSGRSSSTTVSAQTGDFTVSWSTSDQQ